ncbi:MAG: FkbM family methyltransferase [Gaiellaceae bacterium]
MRFVRWLATAPGFRLLTRVGPLLRLSFALRGSLVEERLRFAANELRLRAVTGVYRLQESDVAIAVRHHSDDVLVLDEIFSQREYEPPWPLELPAAPRIVDLGANIGLFGAWALGRFPEATIVAVEADPGNAAVHRRAIEANGLADRWRLVEAFASTAPGVVRFAAGEHALSHRVDEGGLEITAVDVFPDLLDADFVKIDIEGAEWPVLADTRFEDLRADVVVLEYHAQGAPGPDPARAAEDALSAAGYEFVHTARKPSYGAGIVWGRRQPQSRP